MPPLFGKSKVTSLYDSHFEGVNAQLDDMKLYTAKVIEKTHEWIKELGDPNKTSLNKAEMLAEASNRSGQRVPDSPYATALICVTDSERKKGTLNRQLVVEVTTTVLTPLRDWLKNDCMEIMKARDELKRKRSALDSATKHFEKITAKTDATEEMASMADRKMSDAQAAHDAAKATMDDFLGKLPKYQANHEHIINNLHKILETFGNDSFTIEKEYLKIARSDAAKSSASRRT